MDFQPIELLKREGILPHDAMATCAPLGGGVSCDVYLVEANGAGYVVKRALSQLKVADEWLADPERNHYEHRYLSVASEIEPQAFPKVLHTCDDEGWFCMEYLGVGWENWKTQMLGGLAQPQLARSAGATLARVHTATQARPSLREEFDTTDNFWQLRLDPYLLATGRKHPALQATFIQEAERLSQTRECLVHGDYSPKNMLVRDGEICVLDCEVAWFGDPAFDVAFLLNHLCLKALYRSGSNLSPDGFASMIAAFRRAYSDGMPEFQVVEHRVARLLPMLMLARVDGKSPVEYFLGRSDKQSFIRSFSTAAIAQHAPAPLDEIVATWFSKLSE
jgi:aminoglycoside phosphotransferase (APT) family kinase protein